MEAPRSLSSKDLLTFEKDIADNIIQYMSPRSIFSCSTVCKDWWQVIKDHRHRFRLETVQYFLIKLDIKPPMHLSKISIFSLNKDIARLTKIMNNLVKDCKIRTFKVIFQCLKLVESFQFIFSVKNI